jgi:YHS domain-containing protein
MDVDPQSAAFSYEHEGTTYVFCSRGCMLDFSEQPARYLESTYQPQGMDDLPP